MSADEDYRKLSELFSEADDLGFGLPACCLEKAEYEDVAYALDDFKCAIESALVDIKEKKLKAEREEREERLLYEKRLKGDWS